MTPFDFYENVLKSPKYVVAPMVEQSELAWRLLSRKYGAQLTFTPMFHAKNFAESAKYRQENWKYHESDPVIVQFCANDPEILLQACKFVEQDCLAVDLNLGCPQHIAKRGHYGSYLMEEWDLIESMVSKVSKELKVPITCKIRVFPSVEKTIEYAQMLEKAGCKLLTVHGRLREQKGHLTGLADWEIIAKVKKAVKIPVFANGNILYYDDLSNCFEATGVDGIMSAEGNLYNPAIFSRKHYASWFLAQEYLEICNEYKNSATPSQIKAHLFKMFHSCLPLHVDLREKLAVVKTFEECNFIVSELKSRLISEFGEQTEYDGPFVRDERGLLVLPCWVCQPYIRKPATTGLEKNKDLKRKHAESDSGSKIQKN
jgi:tRNA-dihydrouridine synthase 1